MNELLKKINPNNYLCYNYQIKEEKKYAVYTYNIKLKKISIIGDLKIDEFKSVDMVTRQILRPIVYWKKEIEETILSIPNIILAQADWKEKSLEKFVEQFNYTLIENYKSTMNPQDIKFFFEKAHNYYMETFTHKLKLFR